MCLDGIFYRQQENHYVVVAPPPGLGQPAESGPHPLGFRDGRRHYVREGTTTCGK